MNLIDKIEELESSNYIYIEDFSKRNLFVKEYLKFIEDSKIKKDSEWDLDDSIGWYGDPSTDGYPDPDSIDGCIKSNLIYYYKFDDEDKNFHFIISIISNKFFILSKYYVFNIFEDKYEEFKDKIISFCDKEFKSFSNKSVKKNVLRDLTNKYDKYIKEKNTFANVIYEEDSEFDLDIIYDTYEYDIIDDDDYQYTYSDINDWDDVCYIFDLFSDEKTNPTFTWDFIDLLAEDITEFLINNKYSELDTAKMLELY